MPAWLIKSALERRTASASVMATIRNTMISWKRSGMPIDAGLMRSNILTSEPMAARTRSDKCGVGFRLQVGPSDADRPQAEVQKPIATTVRHE